MATNSTAVTFNASFRETHLLQIAGGVFGGQKVIKAFDEKREMNVMGCLWMGIEALHFVKKMENVALLKMHPGLQTALQVGIVIILGINGINAYVGEVKNNEKDWFSKVSVSIWDYSYKACSVFSVFRTFAFSLYFRPVRAVAMLSASVVTILDNRKQLPPRISTFWKQATGNTWLGWGLYGLYMLDGIDRMQATGNTWLGWGLYGLYMLDGIDRMTLHNSIRL